jgi:probable phosphoglycerate mutase
MSNFGANKQLYFVRHGQTDYNKKGIVQGSGVDSNLNKIGIEQALKFHRAYFHLPFSHVFTSELKRTIQTIQPFLENKQIEHKIISGLNEISWGDVEGKILSDFHKKIFESTLNDWKNGFLDRSVIGGESISELQKRQRTAMLEILNTVNSKPALICTHGRAMRSLLCLMTGKNAKFMDEFPHSNLSLYILEGQEIGKFNIVEFNCLSHLDI